MSIENKKRRQQVFRKKHLVLVAKEPYYEAELLEVDAKAPEQVNEINWTHFNKIFTAFGKEKKLARDSIIRLFNDHVPGVSIPLIQEYVADKKCVAFLPRERKIAEVFVHLWNSIPEITGHQDICRQTLTQNKWKLDTKDCPLKKEWFFHDIIEGITTYIIRTAYMLQLELKKLKNGELDQLVLTDKVIVPGDDEPFKKFKVQVEYLNNEFILTIFAECEKNLIHTQGWDVAGRYWTKSLLSMRNFIANELSDEFLRRHEIDPKKRFEDKFNIQNRR